MKKLYLLTVGALVNDPLIQWMTENLAQSKLNEYFDIVWIITVPNEKRKQDCLFQTRNAPFKINILVDENSRTNRVEAMRQILLKMPLNSLIWSIPEGAIVNPNAGENLNNILSPNEDINFGGKLCKGIDHVIFNRPPDGLIHDQLSTEKFFTIKREDGSKEIPLETLYLMRNANNDLEKICVIYWALKYHQRYYTNVYEPIFSKIRNEYFSLLEIGIAQGASLKAFRDYFQKASIIGLDNYPESILKENRIDSFIGDSTNDDTVQSVLKLNNNKKFQIIIDDGNHVPNFQFETFKKFWPALEKNGFYFIEDVYGIEELENNIKNFDSSLTVLKKDLTQLSGTQDSVILCIFRK
jgi:hypothetical protein